jgi:hypothetical protein
MAEDTSEYSTPACPGNLRSPNKGLNYTDVRMNEALVTYAMRAGEKLRQHHVTANYLTVFFHTSAFSQDP